MLNQQARLAIRRMAMEMRRRHDPSAVTDEALIEALVAAWAENPYATRADLHDAEVLARQVLRRAALNRRRGVTR